MASAMGETSSMREAILDSSSAILAIFLAIRPTSATEGVMAAGCFVMTDGQVFRGLNAGLAQGVGVAQGGVGQAQGLHSITLDQ